MRNLLFILLVGCSSTEAARWKIEDVALEKRAWRHCEERFDGVEMHRKGFCYISKECKKRLIGKKCRRLPLFCAYGDLECFDKYKLFNKKLK